MLLLTNWLTTGSDHKTRCLNQRANKFFICVAFGAESIFSVSKFFPEEDVMATAASGAQLQIPAMETGRRPRILILGGGFAGLNAAQKLKRALYRIGTARDFFALRLTHDARCAGVKQKGPVFPPGLCAFRFGRFRNPCRPCRPACRRPARPRIPSSDDRRPSPPS